MAPFDSRIVPNSARTETGTKDRPFGQSEKEYRDAYAEKRLRQRDAILQAQKEARLAKEAGVDIAGPQFATSATSPQTSAQYGPQLYRPRKFATGPIIKVKSLMSGTIAMAIIMGWYFTGQLLLWGMSLTFVGSGALGASVLGPFSSIIESLGLDYAFSTLTSSFIAGGLAISVLNSIFCIVMLFIVLIMFTIVGVNAWGGAGNTTATKKALFILAIVGYTLPFFQILPWGILWVNYVRVNPE